MNNVYIDSFGISGEGIGTHDRLKIFVEGALPEETVLVSITRQKKNYSEGHLEEILTPSSHRIEPKCIHFGECGGCQLMHVAYDAQLIAKQKRVVDALERIGQLKNPPVFECIPSPNPLFYRNKIQLPVIWNQGEKTIGLYKKRSHDVVAIERCWIQSSLGEEILSQIKSHLTIDSVRHVIIRTSETQSQALIILVSNGTKRDCLKELAHVLMNTSPKIVGVVENVNRRDDNVILGKEFHTLAGIPYLTETLLGKTFKISAASFFQVNPLQAENLYKRAIELADLQQTHRVLDLFSGVGTLTLFASDYVKSAVGVETVPLAVADAIENGRINQAHNCSFFLGKAEIITQKLGMFDRVFLNPPRKGCDPLLLKTLIQLKPEKIVYVSCDPATLARDIKDLGYTLVCAQPFDMFPQTMHVETLAVLKRP